MARVEMTIKIIRQVKRADGWHRFRRPTSISRLYFKAGGGGLKVRDFWPDDVFVRESICSDGAALRKAWQMAKRLIRSGWQVEETGRGMDRIHLRCIEEDTSAECDICIYR